MQATSKHKVGFLLGVYIKGPVGQSGGNRGAEDRKSYIRVRGNVQARFWSGGGGGDVFAYRNHTGTGLALLSRRQRAYRSRHPERILAQLACAGGDEVLTDTLAGW